jgi:Mg2+-importing ATPase
MSFFPHLIPNKTTPHPISPQLSGELLEIAPLDAETALKRLASTSEGLLKPEAEERLERYGRNAIAHEARKSVLLQLLGRFKNPLNVMLLVLATLNFAVVGDPRAGTMISVMVLLSVSLSFLQEYRSNQAAEKLRAMVSTTATVLRRDESQELPSEVLESPGIRLENHGQLKVEIPLEELVPGDVVLLSAGDMIPADIRLLAAKDLFVNQAALTGEALPVEKFASLTTDKMGNPLDLPTICFMGTNVISGTALAVVAHTGSRTYFGALAHSTIGQRVLTSFDKGVTRFTWLMIRFMLVMTPLVFLINGITKGNWTEAFIFAMAVAVGLAPEMLPMIVTVNLGKGALDMSRKQVIVKRLNAIQNFGAMEVLCTDKTGTLTQDKVILEKHVNIYGDESEEVLDYAYLNSYYQSGLKNLLDVAVLKYMEVHHRLGIEHRFHKVDEIPFDFLRRRMSVVVAVNSARHLLICKGAIEEVFSVCNRCEIAGEILELDESHAEAVKNIPLELNDDGFRVIAVAYKELAPQQISYSVADECDLVLAGFVAFLDPPKESAAKAIAALEQYGVQVKILTGDNEVVTRKICKEVGLPVERIVLGSEIESLSPEKLTAVVETTTVFAKLSPAQKATVIDALHRQGHVVGFLGDGINDGPALKAADVGISVDTAMDIAKESADIILLEKSLLVLAEGVLEGRKVFGNIIKYIKMGGSSNFGNMFSVIGASAWLPFLPMAPLQVLCNNLLYDFSQTTIPTDHVDEDYLAQPRRWDIGNIAEFMLFIGPISSIFDYVTYFTMYYLFNANTVEKASLFQTGWFVESLLSQTLIIHIIRTRKIPFIQSYASLPLILTTIIICSIGLWLPFSSFAGTLGLTLLPPLYWPILGGILLTYLVLTHLVKTWFIGRFGW